MAKYDKKAALQIIVNAAKEFNVKLNDKHFLIVYHESGQTKTLCVGFRDMNYLHMTGVKTKLSAQQFYSACIDGKLSENDFEIYTECTYCSRGQDICKLPLSEEVKKLIQVEERT